MKLSLGAIGRKPGPKPPSKHSGKENLRKKTWAGPGLHYAESRLGKLWSEIEIVLNLHYLANNHKDL